MVMVKTIRSVEPPLQLLFEASSDIPLSVIKQPNWLPNLLFAISFTSDIIEKELANDLRNEHGMVYVTHCIEMLFYRAKHTNHPSWNSGSFKSKTSVWEATFSQWLDLLCLHHLLTKEGDQFYATTQFINLCLSAPVFQQPVNDWEYVLWDYLEQSLTQHELLFSGKVSPLSLLF